MSRWKAAAIHLSISALIALVSAALIFGVWYPPPYSRATGALELVLLLMGVDVVLGPLLTLVVFKSGKRSLPFDLGVIALLQAGAFAYGMSVVVRARPAYIVAAVDRFSLVAAKDLDAADIAAATQPQYRSLPWTGPRFVGTVAPTEAKEHGDLLFSAIAGKDIDRYPKYYVDYADHSTQLLPRARAWSELAKKFPASAAMLEDWLRAHHRTADSVAWVPLTGPRADLTVVLDAKDGQVLGALDLDPW